MQLDSKKVKLCYSSNKLNIEISLRNKTVNGKMVIKAVGKQLRQFKNNTFFLYLCLNCILLNERGFVGHYGRVLHEILNDWSPGKQLILFPENLLVSVSQDGAEGNIEIRRKQN